jgi:hypothetical protein
VGAQVSFKAPASREWCEGSLGTGGGFKNLERPLSGRWDPCFWLRRALERAAAQTPLCPKKRQQGQPPARLGTRQIAAGTGLSHENHEKQRFESLSLSGFAKRPRIVVLARVQDCDQRDKAILPQPCFLTQRGTVTHSRVLHTRCRESRHFPPNTPSSRTWGCGWPGAANNRRVGPALGFNPPFGPQSTSVSPLFCFEFGVDTGCEVLSPSIPIRCLVLSFQILRFSKQYGRSTPFDVHNRNCLHMQFWLR